MSFFGMPSYILDMCPENRDESNGNSIIKLLLQFIPIFGALHSQLRKGHTTKKDISMLIGRLISKSEIIINSQIKKRGSRIGTFYLPVTLKSSSGVIPYFFANHFFTNLSQSGEACRSIRPAFKVARKTVSSLRTA